jgi:hypothetical protein
MGFVGRDWSVLSNQELERVLILSTFRFADSDASLNPICDFQVTGYCGCLHVNRLFLFSETLCFRGAFESALKQGFRRLLALGLQCLFAKTPSI